MYRRAGGRSFSTTFDRADVATTAIVRAGSLDALVALEQIGSRRNFARDEEIYGEGARADCWYKVIAATVRITKLLADRRRHIAEFCCPALNATASLPSRMRIASSCATGPHLKRSERRKALASVRVKVGKELGTSRM